MKRTIGGKPTYENFLRTHYPSQLITQQTSNEEVANQQVSNQQATSMHSQNQFNQPQMMQHQSAEEKNIWLESLFNSSPLKEHKNQQTVSELVGSVPRLNNSNTQQSKKSYLTEDILSKLLISLLLNDLETCVRIAELANLEELMQIKSESGITLLMLAAQHGCTDAIITILRLVSDPQRVAEMVDKRGHTALMIATIYDKAESITAIYACIPYRQQLALITDRSGESVLMVAMKNKNTKSISALLSDISNAYPLIALSNSAALSYSVLNGDIEACKAMLQSVPSLKKKMRLIEKTNYCGETLLTLAAKLGHTEMIQVIRESIEIESSWVKLVMIKNYSGKTALTIAMENSNLEMIKVLMINITNKREMKLMPYIAMCHQKKEKEQRLIEIAQQDENNALKNAVIKGSAELVKVLLDSEFDLIQRQKLVTKHAQNENSLWWHAVNNMQSDVVKILLGSVYKPNQRQALLQMTDGNGKAALQIAANKGNIEMARNLLQAAVDSQEMIFQEDNIGMNAFMLAALNQHTTLALLIFDKTIDKYELLNQCSKYQVHTIDLVSQKLSKELISRLTQIVNDHPREDLKNLIQNLKKSQIKNLDIENQ